MAKGDTIQLYHAIVAGAQPEPIVEGEFAIDALSTPAHLYVGVPTSRDPSGMVDVLGGYATTAQLTSAVSGALNFSSGSATGNFTVGGDLGVTGSTAIGGNLGITGDTTIGGNLTVAGLLTGANPWIPFGYSFNPSAPVTSQWKATGANATAVYASTASQGAYPTLATYLDFFADGGLTVGQTITPTLIMRLTYEAWREVYWAQFYQPLSATAINATTLVSSGKFYGLGDARARLVQIASYNADVPGPWTGDYLPGTGEKAFRNEGGAGITMFTDAGYIGNGPRGNGTVNPPDGQLGWSWSNINLGNTHGMIQHDYRINGAGQNSGANPNVARLDRIWIGFAVDTLYPGITPPASYPVPSIYLPSFIMDAVTNTATLNAQALRLTGNYNNTAPAAPQEGMLWADSGTHHLRYYNGSTWVQIA